MKHELSFGAPNPFLPNPCPFLGIPFFSRGITHPLIYDPAPRQRAKISNIAVNSPRNFGPQLWNQRLFPPDVISEDWWGKLKNFLYEHAIKETTSLLKLDPIDGCLLWPWVLMPDGLEHLLLLGPWTTSSSQFSSREVGQFGAIFISQLTSAYSNLERF